MSMMSIDVRHHRRRCKTHNILIKSYQECGMQAAQPQFKPHLQRVHMPEKLLAATAKAVKLYQQKRLSKHTSRCVSAHGSQLVMWPKSVPLQTFLQICLGVSMINLRLWVLSLCHRQRVAKHPEPPRKHNFLITSQEDHVSQSCILTSCGN